MTWKTVKLGDFLIRVRQPVKIQDNDKYRLVKIRTRHQGVELREEKAGLEIGIKTMYYVSAGQFILSGIDARHGAFGIVPESLEGSVITNDFWCFDVDESIVSHEYFYLLTTTPYFTHICKAASDGTTNRVRLQADKFYNLEFAIPDFTEQAVLVARLKTALNAVQAIEAHLDHQLSTLADLRQSILREAVQGQLTARWRQQNPATETGTDLLTRIRAYKLKLIAAGKLKKEKPLPPVTSAETPFELPDGWVWCRLGDVAEMCLGKMLDAHKNKGNLQPYLRNVNVRWHSFNLDNLLDMRFKKEEEARFAIEKGDIVICEGGEPGRAAIWESDTPIKFQKALHRVRTYDGLLYNWFFLHYLTQLAGSGALANYFTGATIQHFTGKVLENLPIPLPPFAEQQAIVERVAGLFGKVDALAERLNIAQQTAGRLRQAVLREAFSPEIEPVT